MRTPTSYDQAYAWHRKAIAANGDRNKMPPVHENSPQAGWFIRRLIPKGPFVPCRIWLESPTDPVTGELSGPEIFRCEVDGQPRRAESEWSWLCSRPISEDDYMDMLANKMAARARAASQDHPAPQVVAEMREEAAVINSNPEPNAGDDLSGEWEPPF